MMQKTTQTISNGVIAGRSTPGAVRTDLCRPPRGHRRERKNHEKSENSVPQPVCEKGKSRPTLALQLSGALNMHINIVYEIVQSQRAPGGGPPDPPAEALVATM